MRKIFVFGLLMFLALSCISQTNWKVGLDMGPTWPLSTYNQFDKLDITSGYAERGFKLNFDASYFLNSRFAVTGRINFGSNTMDDKELYDQLYDLFENYFPEDQEETKGLFHDMGSWSWTSILIGPKTSFPIIKQKIYGELAAYSGIQFTQSPEMGMSYEDEKTEMYYRSSNIDNEATDIPISAIAALRFKINNRISIYTGIEYYRCKTSFSTQSSSYDINSNERTILEERSHEPTIQNMQTTVGLVYTIF